VEEGITVVSASEHDGVDGNIGEVHGHSQAATDRVSTQLLWVKAQVIVPQVVGIWEAVM